MFMVVGTAGVLDTHGSVLTPEEGRQDRKRHRVGMFVEAHQDEKRVHGLKIVVRRRESIGDVRVSETEKNGACSEWIGCREDDFEIRFEEDEHGQVLGLAKVDERLRVNAFESKTRKELAQDVPPMQKTIAVDRRLVGKGQPKTQSNRPGIPQTLTGFRRQGRLGIRIRRSVISSTPLPESCEPKPPGLSTLFECKVVKRMLPIFRLVGKDVLVIRKTLPLQNTGTRKGKTSPYQPPPSDSLGSFQGDASICVNRRPENRNSASSMPATQTMSSKRIRLALQETPFLSHRRTAYHCVGFTLS